jgi:hypothetical protein
MLSSILKSHIFILVFALVFFDGASLALAESSSVNITNNISSSSNTGGNSGGNVTTGSPRYDEMSNRVEAGDASVVSRVVNKISDNLNKKLENKVEAEVKGGGKASVSVNGEEKNCTAADGEACKVEINNDEIGSGGSAVANGDTGNNGDENGIEGDNGNKNDGTVEGATVEKKGMLGGVAETIGNIFEKAFGGLMSIFK